MHEGKKCTNYYFFFNYIIALFSRGLNSVLGNFGNFYKWVESETEKNREVFDWVGSGLVKKVMLNRIDKA